MLEQSTPRRGWALKIALLITFFGDYCSLIGIMEFAKQFGGSAKVVSIFIAYGLPSLALLLLTNIWSKHQQQPIRQLAAFYVLGAISISSLHWTVSYLHVLIVTILLGLVKETTHVLVNVHIKSTYPEKTAKGLVNDIVTTRFFIMVFGGALGGYLGEIGRFDAVFLIDAASFIVAAGLFLIMHATPKLTPASTTDTEKLTVMGGLGNIGRTFRSIPLTWIVLSAVGIGSFMALEYPLITTDLRILPRYMGAIYAWHVGGALLARAVGRRLLKAESLLPRLCTASICLIIAFGVVGVWGPHLALVGFQIGCIAFFMVLTEVLASCTLMTKTAVARYPHANLCFRIIQRSGLFAGSFIPLALVGHISLSTTNLLCNAVLLSIGGTIAGVLVVSRYCGLRPKEEYEATS